MTAPDIVLSKTGLTVTEGVAAGSSYTVALATLPSDTVIVTISGHDGTDLSLDKTTLTFTDGQLGHRADGDGRGGSRTTTPSTDTVTLTHTATSTDSDYASITAKNLTVTVTDDDTCGDRAQRDGPHRDGGSRRGVELHSEAGHPALRHRHCHHLRTRRRTDLMPGQDDADQQPVDLHHGPTGPRRRPSRSRRAMTTTPSADTATLTHTASGGDYASITAKNLLVTVTDDDTAGIVLSKTSLTVTEGDATGVELHGGAGHPALGQRHRSPSTGHAGTLTSCLHGNHAEQQPC